MIQILSQASQTNYSDIITIISNKLSFRYYHNHHKTCFYSDIITIISKPFQSYISIIISKNIFRYYHNHVKNLIIQILAKSSQKLYYSENITIISKNIEILSQSSQNFFIRILSQSSQKWLFRDYHNHLKKYSDIITIIPKILLFRY